MEYKDNIVNYTSYVNRLVSMKLINTEDETESVHWNNLVIDPKLLAPLYFIFKEGMKLLDLGCGVGNVLKFANNIGFKTKGIEKDKRFISSLTNYDHLIKNILDVDPREYNKYDVIYSYNSVMAGNEDFLNSVIDNMKVGAYLFTPAYPIQDKRLEVVLANLYIKID